ncbi:MAG: Rne/Rng family ribonuclease [Alphaproteobacteria bacterium GM7ARS4]|nr:Rne/Rng family ribonuclease [Alphaproteobacteria bacterium GM7ARS4]
MTNRILVDCLNWGEIRVAICKDGVFEHYYHENQQKESSRGNIYLAKINNIEPSLQAAFVEYGESRQGFLSFHEIHQDYYKEDPLVPSASQDATGQAEVAFLDERDVQASQFGDDNTTRTFDETNASDTGTPTARKNGALIQHAVQVGQVMLVQVIKEGRRNKGAALTTFLSLPGVYCVLFPNAKNNHGISHKIEDETERERLYGVIEDLNVPEGFAIAIRTSAQGVDKKKIDSDFKNLCTIWNEIREHVTKSSAPLLVHQEAHILKRVVRDYYRPSIDEIIVNDSKAYDAMLQTMKKYRKDDVKALKRFKGEEPLELFETYDVAEPLNALHSKICPLPGGGYLVIETTEAMVVIDVNSGKQRKKKDIESTAFSVNMEAAVAVARQIRLRELSGLIMIDFIDMADQKANARVEKALRDALAQDHARLQMGKISPFGVMEITRQRVGPNFMESYHTPCPHCFGRGVVPRPVITVHALQRTLKTILQKKGSERYHITIPLASASTLLNDRKNTIQRLEEHYHVAISISIDDSMPPADYAIDDGRGQVTYRSGGEQFVDGYYNNVHDSYAQRGRRFSVRPHHRGVSKYRSSERKIPV